MSVENDTNARGVILAPPHQTAEILALLDDLSAVMHALCYEIEQLRRTIEATSPPRKSGVRNDSRSCGRLLAYEMEDMGEEEYLQFFADLISSGWVHHLQGHYGRQAAWLVENGFISLEGEVLRGFGDDY